MSPESTYKLMGFYMEGLILGINTMYMLFCFLSCFPIGCLLPELLVKLCCVLLWNESKAHSQRIRHVLAFPPHCVPSPQTTRGCGRGSCAGDSPHFPRWACAPRQSCRNARGWAVWRPHWVPVQPQTAWSREWALLPLVGREEDPCRYSGQS